MHKLRVVLANTPRILADILRDLVDRQPDMAVVGEVRNLDELSPTIAAVQAHAVILTFSPPRSGQSICGVLRELHPALTLLGLALRTDRAVVWPPKAAPHAIEVTAAAILSALRGHVGRDQPH